MDLNSLVKPNTETTQTESLFEALKQLEDTLSRQLVRFERHLGKLTSIPTAAPEKNDAQSELASSPAFPQLLNKVDRLHTICNQMYKLLDAFETL